MPQHRNLPAPERAVRSRLLRLIGQPRPLLRASLVTMKRLCGKLNCHCQQGQPHVSLYLATRVGQRRKMIYVPEDMEDMVRQWVADAHLAEQCLDQISQVALDRLLRHKQDKAARS